MSATSKPYYRLLQFVSMLAMLATESVWDLRMSTPHAMMLASVSHRAGPDSNSSLDLGVFPSALFTT